MWGISSASLGFDSGVWLGSIFVGYDLAVSVGAKLRAVLGNAVDVPLGFDTAARIGSIVGERMGFHVGTSLGDALESTDAATLGFVASTWLGPGVGEEMGVSVGDLLGAPLGCAGGAPVGLLVEVIVYNEFGTKDGGVITFC